jgi:hypothetical protein
MRSRLDVISSRFLVGCTVSCLRIRACETSTNAVVLEGVVVVVVVVVRVVVVGCRLALELLVFGLKRSAVPCTSERCVNANARVCVCMHEVRRHSIATDSGRSMMSGHTTNERQRRRTTITSKKPTTSLEFVV